MIHIIVTAYALVEDLFRLYESCHAPDVCWHLFLHSDFPAVVDACEKLARDPQVHWYDYRVNRGLARSWNDGWEAAQREGAESVLIASDDAYAGPGDLYRLVHAAQLNPDVYKVSGKGYDERENRIQDQHFSLAVINPIAWSLVGNFDQNFWPIYFEDRDWYRRAELAGLQAMCIEGTHIYHAGSKTLYTATDMETHHRRFRANEAYYVRKWGGRLGEETFTRPFNQAQFGQRIEPLWRSQPYPGFNRPREETGV